jgi:hypothetical protein
MLRLLRLLQNPHGFDRDRLQLHGNLTFRSLRLLCDRWFAVFVFHGVPSVDLDSLLFRSRAHQTPFLFSRDKRKAATEGAPSLSAPRLDSPTGADLLIRVAIAVTASFSPSSSGEQ